MKQFGSGGGLRPRGAVLPAAVVLIAAAAGLLGVLQFRWAARVSEADGARLRQSLRTSAGQVLGSTSEELRVLQALLFVTEEELTGEDWGRFAAAVAFFRANSHFAGLLRTVYLVVPQGASARFRRFDEVSGGFREEAAAPEALRGLFAAQRQGEESGNSRPRSSAAELLQGGLLLSPIIGPGGEETRAGPPAVLALAVDLDVVWREVIPHYMDQHLEGYPYRLVELSSGAVLSGSAAADQAGRRSPDFSIGLHGPPLFWNRAPGAAEEQPREPAADQPLNVLEQYLQQDPAVRFWLQRSSGSVAPELRRWLEEGQREQAPMRLEIFYPGAAIETLVTTRRTANLGLSGVVLLLLLASTGVLLRLYRNSARLRTMEQEFVASMSHELRTPLAVLQSTSENLKAGLVTDPGRLARYSEVIHRETRRLAGMVEGILLYSGIENRTPRSFTPARTDLDRLVADVALSLEQPAHEAGCRIRVSVPPGIGAIRSDPLALRLILENLLLNAVRHGNPGEVRLAVQGGGPAGGLGIVVEDDGPGIPAREQRRVFEPFVRGEASVRAQRPGSGLGLHLVRRVARILGGSVRLESPYRGADGRANGGCRFSVELPARTMLEDEEDPADRG